MRLKSKIIVICSIVVLLAASLCSISVYVIMDKNFHEEAAIQTLQAATEFYTSLDEKLAKYERRKEGPTDNMMSYVIKNMSQGSGSLQIACFNTGDRNNVTGICNDTELEYEDLKAAAYDISARNLDCAYLQKDGDYYVIYRNRESYGGYALFYVENITYVEERLRILGGSLIVLTLISTLLASIASFIMVSKVLKPLQKLRDSANQIALGEYDQRIVIERQDEIGELSESFNRMVEAVEIRTRSLEESEQRKTLFMGNLTHELKTPLTAISGYAKTLLTVRLPEEDKEEALSFIYEESCRLERLSKKMMQLLLLDNDDKLVKENVTAKELFHLVYTICKERAAQHQVTLEMQEAEQSFEVDKDLFVEVLVNLIDNAVKASKQGDKILVFVKDGCIYVGDHGRGIPAEEKEKILEPFYMIDKSRSRQHGGAGLGLAITTRILQVHNWTMQIESEEGKGTTIILHP